MRHAHKEQGGLPGNQQGHDEIGKDLNRHGQGGCGMQVGCRSAHHFGSGGIGHAANLLTEEISPAGRKQGPQQGQAQVGGYVGHRVANLAVGNQDQDAP